MAGGTGKYNHRLIAALANAASAGEGVGDSAPSGSGLPAGKRHCWVLGTPEDPGPHAGLLVGGWVRRDAEWFVKATWYSEAEDAVVQQWLPASSLRPA